MSGVIIIAEAGVNHNGDVSLAESLIDAAAHAGVDYVKFQTFIPEKLVSRFAQKAEYQKQATGAAESQLSMLQKLQLNKEQHLHLVNRCKEKNVRFLSTAFDLESIQLLKELGITTGKIPSGEITNYPYLVKMAQSFEKIILSTGMSDLSEIEMALSVLLKHGKKLPDITILHCNTEYPSPMRDVNLHAMETIRKKFGTQVGYSDHTVGIEVPIAAVALGAAIIEKHFTLDRNLPGPDHKASLEPHELGQMVKAIRNIEQALGSPEKKVSDSERKNISAARKSIVAAKKILKGDTFTETNLTVKRPGSGISPMRWEEIIGKTASRDFEEDELIDV